MTEAQTKNAKNAAIEQKKCVTHTFQLSFAKLAKAESFQGGDPKYSITMLFPNNIDLSKPADGQKTSMKHAAYAALVEKWGSDKTKWPKNLRMPFRDGNEKEDLEGYADKIFVYASSKKQPGMVNQSLKPILNIEEELYSGCFCRAEVIAFAYDTAGNRGVSFSIQNIQKLSDGTPFSGRKAAQDVFDAVEDLSADSDLLGSPVAASAEVELGF